ncbi:MAG: hypothetical protein GY694_22215, partial [Gammaproteobacteria bacterium]|nr:hypothetical protein [Gammaproteobacteria bacterium]
CPICNEDIYNDGKISKITEKGAEGINIASRRRGNDIVVEAGVNVHIACRKRYTDTRDIEKKEGADPPINLKKRTRNTESSFKNKTDCFFCGVTITPDSSDYSEVKTHTFADSIKTFCLTRCDDWATAVKGRMEYYCGDLYAAGCIYHHACDINFRTYRDVPQQYSGCSSKKQRKTGRPRNEDQEQAFFENVSLSGSQ